MRRTMGIGTALQCIRALRNWSQAQPKQPKPIWLHNDFHPNNVLVDNRGKLYLTDFEQTTEERRWVLVDIVHYATDAYSFTIDVDLIRCYVDRLEASAVFAGPLDYSTQLRFALLLRSMHHLFTVASPSSVKERYRHFVTAVLLSDQAYSNWYEWNRVF